MPVLGFTITRSDGRDTVLLNNQEVVNGPRSGADANGREYKLMPRDDPKHEDWRKKLGLNLTKDLPPEEVLDKELFLNNLPTGYRLWVHSAATIPAAVDVAAVDAISVNKKTRTDVYLYGHPLGTTKRYRSAEEFRPHLLWLATSSELNPKLCTCKNCKGKDKPAAMANEAEAATSKPALFQMQSAVLSPIREQVLDSDPSVPYLYRPGELVWFNKGATWGLAIICKRQMVNSVPEYHLQPLSHPLRHYPLVAKGQEDLRPWLAWTLPRPTHAKLINYKFDSVPWEAVLRGEFDRGDAEVDGSILAGREVNDTYTPFTPIAKKTTDLNDVQYAGMFLGAEKIWTGEAVRMKASNNEVVIMIIESIVNNSTTATETQPSLTIIGDIYTFVQMLLPVIYNDKKNWPTPRLPPRMFADLRWRNEIAFEKRRNIWSDWQLTESKAKRGLSEIKGRWYETRRLLPILRPNEFNTEVAAGETYDAGVWMNSRFDFVNDALSRKDRLEAFGRAVPDDLKIILEPDGLPEHIRLSGEKSNVLFDKFQSTDSQYGSKEVNAGEIGSHAMDVDPELAYQTFYDTTSQQ